MIDSPDSVMQSRIESNTFSYNHKDKSNTPSIDPADYTLVTTKVAAEMLGISYNTLWLWRRQGTGPRSIKVGKQRVRFRLVDIKDWLETNARTSAK